MTTTIPATTTEPTVSGRKVQDYLVEMSNLAADHGDQLSEFECTYNEQFWPGFCSGEFADDEEFEPPEYTEEELFEQQKGFWLGFFDLYLGHANVLTTVDVPPGFEAAHQDYGDAFTVYFGYLSEQITGFTDLDQFTEFLGAAFDPLAQLPAEHERLLLALVESCRSLEDLGSEAGYRSNLDCPTPPPEAISVVVEIGDQWSAIPDPLPVGEGPVAMTITNTRTEAIRPVVLEISQGDPLNLPIDNGVVDISRSGEYDPASGYAEFYVHYAGENWEVIGEPLELLPDESVEAVVWSEGTLVVFDYRRGEFEAGAFVVIERSGSRGD